MDFGPFRSSLWFHFQRPPKTGVYPSHDLFFGAAWTCYPSGILSGATGLLFVGVPPGSGPNSVAFCEALLKVQLLVV